MSLHCSEKETFRTRIQKKVATDENVASMTGYGIGLWFGASKYFTPS